MLQAIRASTGSWIVKAFLGVIALSFGIWGVGDMVTGGSDPVVISVGDEEVTASTYQREFQRLSRNVQARFNRPLDNETLRMFGLHEQAERALVDRALLRQAADDMGLAVSEDWIRNDTYNMAAFQNSLGRFDPLVFERTINGLGVTQEGYFSARQDDFAREHLVRSVVGSGVVPVNLVKTLFAYRQERRVAEVLVIPADRFQDIPEPGDAALRGYYEANEALFTAPEYRAVTYLTLEPENLLDEVSAEEVELRDAYDAHLDEYTTPATRKVRQMVLADEDTAKSAHAALLEGRTFDDVATEFAGASGEDLDLGTVTKDELPVEIAEVVFALAEGGISTPVKSPFGWHIATASEIVEEKTRTFEEARAELDRQIRLEKARDALFDLGNRLQDELAAGATLEEAARNLGLDATRVEAVDAAGSDRNGQPVAGLERGGEVLQAAFQSDEGILSELIETDDGGYVVVRIDRIIPPALRPLDEVRDAVAIGWRSELRMKRAEAEAQRLAELARAGKQLSELAEQDGLERRLTPALTRAMGRAQDLVSNTVLAKLFAIGENDIVTGPGADGQGQVVARLSEIRPTDPDTDAAALDNLRRELENGYTGDRLDEFRSALTRRYPVEIERNRIDALYRRQSG